LGHCHQKTYLSEQMKYRGAQVIHFSQQILYILEPNKYYPIVIYIFLGGNLAKICNTNNSRSKFTKFLRQICKIFCIFGPTNHDII